MDDAQLNKAVAEICDDEQFNVNGLEDTGKCIAYIGWYWRDVDFGCSYGITLGICGEVGQREALSGANMGWVGFMENNKWGYAQFQVKDKRQRRLRQMVEQAVTAPSDKKLQALFDYMQTLRPEQVNSS